jgi:hypothetical protein
MKVTALLFAIISIAHIADAASSYGDEFIKDIDALQPFGLSTQEYKDTVKRLERMYFNSEYVVTASTYNLKNSFCKLVHRAVIPSLFNEIKNDYENQKQTGLMLAIIKSSTSYFIRRCHNQEQDIQHEPVVPPFSSTSCPNIRVAADFLITTPASGGNVTLFFQQLIRSFDGIQDPVRCLKYISEALFRVVAEETNVETADFDVHHEFWNFVRYVTIDYLVAHRVITGESTSETFSSNCNLYYNQLESVLREAKTTKFHGKEDAVALFLRANKELLNSYIKCSAEQKKSAACQSQISQFREYFIKAIFRGSPSRVKDLESSLESVGTACEN